ncbi:MAG: CRISPR-associated helicase Cas3' [Candidatus Cloacimonas acidaminovorans]|nr:CRISPR-associated helicase Cas3' [Candidatus Cloacimonas acidaminovorans]
MDFNLYSHPGILLKDHLQQVLVTGLNRFEENQLYQDDLQLLKVILAFHDLGKASTYFQEYLSAKRPGSNLCKHSEFSAIWAYCICLEQFNLDDLSSLIAYFIVRYHHSDLGDILDKLVPDLEMEELLEINSNLDYPELNNIYVDLGINVTLSEEIFRKIFSQIEKKPFRAKFRAIKGKLRQDEWIRIYYLFSLLIWADKNVAIFHKTQSGLNERKWKSLYVDNYKNKLANTGSAIDRIRNEAYNELPLNLKEHHNTYSINMPTGSGKTICSLKVALELLKKHKNLQRIIYSLPFTSIIDQNHKVFQDILKLNSIPVTSDIILAHHHLSELSYIEDKYEYSVNESEFLVETWDSELIITTFVQLLSSCLSIRNRNLKRFHRLANAVIILDEVQNVPHKYWQLLKYIFDLLTSRLNSIIILVTATLPMIYNPKSDPIIELATDKEHWFGELNRIKIDKTRIAEKLNIEDLAGIIEKEHLANPTVKRLIIVNTIRSSLELYKILTEKLSNTKFIYLSSNVIPKVRLDRIEQIKNSKNEGMIIVSTQVVEAGVDIDVDIVYRDLAPFDSIIQASGRCNRNYVKSQATVIVLQLVDNNKPYWRYIYDETLINATLKTLDKVESNIIPESELYSLSEFYFKMLPNITSSEESRDIINNLSLLNLDSAFYYHPKINPKAFNLIESYLTKTVFVEYDTDASNLLSKYLSLLTSHFDDFYEWSAQLRDQVRRMNPYIININKKYIVSDDPIFVIDKDSMQLYYDIETGFKLYSTAKSSCLAL